MTKNKADIEAIEHYLSDVDQYLVSYGVDPRQRLDFIDEAADTLLQAPDSRPVDAFGPAEDYASNLASALGVSRHENWRRLLTLFVGTWLAALCLTSLAVQYLPLPSEGFDAPFWFHPFSDVPTAFAVTFGAWAVLTPSGARASGAGRGQAERFVRIVAGVAVALIVMVVFFNLVARDDSLIVEPASLGVMLPVLMVGLVAGLGLIWRSRWPQTAFALLSTSKTRPDSSLTYNMFSHPTVRVNSQVPPSRAT